MPDRPPKPERTRLQPTPVETAPTEPQVVHLHQLQDKSADFRHLLMHILIPVELLVDFGIDPITLRNETGQVMVETASSQEGHVWGLRVLNDIDPRDPLLEIEMSDTVFGRISVTWVSMNDPRTPRFAIDVTEEGESTLRGTARRNREAEAAALLAGLAPGQTRAGLGLFSRLLWDLEQFIAALHHYEFEVEPLFYHSAVLFERSGFAYVQGREFMKHIHRSFLEGGAFLRQLDGSTPFRDPFLAQTVRGRAWALHDGVLDGPWGDVKLVKRIGQRAREQTAFGVDW